MGNALRIFFDKSDIRISSGYPRELGLLHFQADASSLVALPANHWKSQGYIEKLFGTIYFLIWFLAELRGCPETKQGLNHKQLFASPSQTKIISELEPLKTGGN